MQFQLPSDLQTQLIAYDPSLKKLAREQKPKSTKVKYPIGLPPVLIPEEIVRSSLYENAIDEINRGRAAERFHEFRNPVGTIPNVEYITHAVIYHWEGLWVAAWLPPKDKASEYIYGLTYCYKDIASTRNKLPHNVARDTTFESKTVGRSNYMIKTRYVTKQDIMQGDDTRHWFICNAWGQKGMRMGDAVRRFENSLRNSIPVWADATNIFARIREGNSLYQILFNLISKPFKERYFEFCLEKYNMTEDTWQLNANTFLLLAEVCADRSIDIYTGISLNVSSRVNNILNKPFFRKWIQSQCDITNQVFNDPTNTLRRKVSASIRRIFHLVDMLSVISNIWPDAPIDYYQNNLDALISIRSIHYPSIEPARLWLREHMPVASFFQILSKYYKESMDEITNSPDRHRWTWDDAIDVHRFRFNALDDTFSMLARIYEHGKTIDPPKRWRIEEFHDHVQAENWKIQNPNHSLPQDLFPQPIKVSHNKKNWSFFQPIDTHQLGQWGQAVRNCVGNAQHYAEGVRKKNHFIVLAMLDGKPTFTIQTLVNHGVMSVQQIVKYGNANLNSQEREEYTQAFAQALRIRDEQLKSER
jgi:hypothetical protein